MSLAPADRLVHTWCIAIAHAVQNAYAMTLSTEVHSNRLGHSGMTPAVDEVFAPIGRTPSVAHTNMKDHEQMTIRNNFTILAVASKVGTAKLAMRPICLPALAGLVPATRHGVSEQERRR